MTVVWVAGYLSKKLVDRLSLFIISCIRIILSLHTLLTMPVLVMYGTAQAKALQKWNALNSNLRKMKMTMTMKTMFPWQFSVHSACIGVARPPPRPAATSTAGDALLPGPAQRSGLHSMEFIYYYRYVYYRNSVPYVVKSVCQSNLSPCIISTDQPWKCSKFW